MMSRYHDPVAAAEEVEKQLGALLATRGEEDGLQSGQRSGDNFHPVAGIEWMFLADGPFAVGLCSHEVLNQAVG